MTLGATCTGLAAHFETINTELDEARGSQHSMPRLSFRALLLLVIGVALGLTVLEAAFGPAKQYPALAANLPRPKTQQSAKRVWRRYIAVKLLSFGGTAKSTLSKPGSLQVGTNGDIFIRDDGTLSIKRFSAAGTLLQAYGKEGEGSGAFRALTDFIVDANDRIWIADPISRRVTVFNKDGSVHKTINLSLPPYRLALVSDAQLIIMVKPFKAPDLFATFDVSAKPEKLRATFGNLLSKQARDAAALDGWVSNSPSAFVFAPMYCGYLVSYDFQGRLRFIVHTIGSAGLPPMRSSNRASAARLLDPEVSLRNLCVSVDADKVYVLCMINLGSKKIGVVDVYSMKDGDYRYSLRLPEPSRRMVVQAGKIFTFSDERATGWAIDFAAPEKVANY